MISNSPVKPEAATIGTGVYLYVILPLQFKRNFAPGADRALKNFLICEPRAAERTEDAFGVYVFSALVAGCEFFHNLLIE
jgi:hypothetical protein